VWAAGQPPAPPDTEAKAEPFTEGMIGKLAGVLVVAEHRRARWMKDLSEFQQPTASLHRLHLCQNAGQKRGKIMNRGRFTTIASAFAIAGLGLSLALVGPAGAAPTSAAAQTRAGSAAASAQPVVLNCLGKAQVKPGTITLTCADGNDALIQLHWTSWTPQLASAYGTERANDCKPSCAEGHIHYYPMLAMLWGSATVTGHPGEHRYTKATLSYSKGRPAVYVTGCNGQVEATYPVIQARPLGA